MNELLYVVDMPFGKSYINLNQDGTVKKVISLNDASRPTVWGKEDVSLKTIHTSKLFEVGKDLYDEFENCAESANRYRHEIAHGSPFNADVQTTKKISEQKNGFLDVCYKNFDELRKRVDSEKKKLSPEHEFFNF